MEIEIENDDSANDISDGESECLYCTGLFSHGKHGEKWAQCVRCYHWVHEDCGGWRRLLCVPHVQKKCKIINYIMKTPLSHIKASFVF